MSNNLTPILVIITCAMYGYGKQINKNKGIPTRHFDSIIQGLYTSYVVIINICQGSENKAVREINSIQRNGHNDGRVACASAGRLHAHRVSALYRCRDAPGA